ncbi:unnamed protein product [Amoebophrya sp. A120]|nr:unnamed protein product [Amoebophrya sp. A120]|eukprot:GSA120T00016156001.1
MSPNKTELVDKLRAGILEAACHRYFATTKGKYARDHDGLEAKEAYHQLKKFGIRIYKQEKLRRQGGRIFGASESDKEFSAQEQERYLEKLKQAEKLPEDTPPDGITKEFCVEEPEKDEPASSWFGGGGGKKDNTKLHKKRPAQLKMRSKHKLLDLAKQKPDGPVINFPKTIQNAYDLNSCNLNPAGEALPRNHSPPAFKVLSDEIPTSKKTATFSPEMFDRYKTVFSHENPCLFDDSPVDCMLTAEQKVEKNFLLEALKDDGQEVVHGKNDETTAFLFDVKANEYAICGATGTSNPTLQHGAMHCAKIRITKYPIYPIFPKKLRREHRTAFEMPRLEKNFAKFVQQCNRTCKPKFENGKKIGLCFLPDVVLDPEKNTAMTDVFCRKAEDLLLIPERDRKVTVGTQVEVLDKSRGKEKGSWLLGKVTRLLFPEKDASDDLSGLGYDQADDGGSLAEKQGSVASDPRTSFDKKPCPPVTGCAEIDFLNSDGGLNRKLNVQRQNRIYPVQIGKTMRFPAERVVSSGAML